MQVTPLSSNRCWNNCNCVFFPDAAGDPKYETTSTRDDLGEQVINQLRSRKSSGHILNLIVSSGLKRGEHHCLAFSRSNPPFQQSLRLRLSLLSN
mmetsp:Transcript_3223/g.6729  ORF Transcript_3223/g.6729 Transcript_3223/m.6729 type:complete len:95 (-) Transcript_3223:235-519(-)